MSSPVIVLIIINNQLINCDHVQHHYGSYLEEQWCQIYLPDGGVAYFNKLTGVLQYGGRPDDFRPNLKVIFVTIQGRTLLPCTDCVYTQEHYSCIVTS